MKTSTRVALNAATYWLSVILRAAIAFALVPLLITELGKDGFGLTALVGSVIIFATLLDAGMRTAAARNLAGELALKHTEQAARIASTTFIAYLVIGLVTAALSMAVLPFALRWIDIPARRLGDAMFLVRWYVPGMIFIQCAKPTYSAILTSKNRFDAVNLAEALSAVLGAALMVLMVVVFRAGLPGWALAMTAARVVNCLAVAACSHRISPEVRIDLRLFRRGQLRSVLSLATGISFLRASNLIGVQTDPVVLSAFLGAGSVSMYSPCEQLSRMFRTLAGVLKMQLHPVAAAAQATGNAGRLRAILFRGTRYTLLMGIPFCVLMGTFAGPIVYRWLGKSLGEDWRIAAQVLFYWAIVDLFAYAMGTQWSILLALKRLRFLIVVRTIESVLNVTGSIVLVACTDLGVIGVVIPTMVMMSIRWPVVSIYTAWRCETTFLAFLSGAFLRPGAVLVILSVLAVGLRLGLRCDTLGSLLSCVAVVALAWALLTWRIGFEPGDRREFGALFSRGVASLKQWARQRTDSQT